MLFAVLVGIVGVAIYFLKGLRVKLRFILSGGKKKEETGEEIPFVIFSDDKRYWPVFEPVVCELDKRGFDVTYLTQSEDDPVLAANYPHMKAEFIGEGNKGFMRLNFMKATMVLSTTPGLDVYQWKRSKDVKYYIHMPHMPGELTIYHMFGTDYYDAMMLSGQYQIDDCRALEMLRNLPEKECRIIGIPYLDEMAKRLEKDETNKLQREADIRDENAPRTVLVAPSWGSNSLLNRFGNQLIDKLVATGYHIIIRPHPQSFTSEKELIDRLMKDYPQLEWNRDTDNFDVLRRSDIMISDFSGVIFDFALVFDKPVICAYTDFDKSPYDAWWLDTPIWTATAVPRIGPILSEENLPEIKELIDRSIEDDSFAVSRRMVRNETWSNYGKGAEEAADYLIGKYNQLIMESEAEEEQTPGKAEAIPAETGSKKEAGDKMEQTYAEDRVLSDNTSLKEAAVSETASDKTIGRKKKTGKIAIFVGIGVILLIGIFALRYYLSFITEKQYERADLETMHLAEGVGRMLFKQQRYQLEETTVYWFNPQTITLSPIDKFDKPVPYGTGTTLNGNAIRDYLDDGGKPMWNYDGKLDYTDQVLKVTLIPETEDIIMEWVVSDTKATEESTSVGEENSD